jgi:diaminohydroxyphosphoribosylaminopyrimidine deaminase/5-amino-6-(5-phosphoribosylamino)uracil reductase
MTTLQQGSESWTDEDRVLMSRALLLAQRGLYSTDPNPHVGCVLVRHGETVGEGWHERAGGPHAEASALAAAGDRARGATAYISLEPCNHQGRTPPCTVALIEAGVARVIYALRDPNPRVSGAGDERLRAAGVEVRSGLMAGAAQELNCGYVKRMSSGLPWVRVKLAMSLDGRTALANGESRWITGDNARMDVQHFRARSSAVLTGIGTVLGDDPLLTVRLPESGRQPWRVVLDSRLRTPSDSHIIGREGPVLIIGAEGNTARRSSLESRGVTVEILPAVDGRPSLQRVLERLAALQMNEVWVEAGPTLAGAFVKAGLFDELIVYVAPALLGGDALPLLQLPAIQSLEQKLPLRFTDIRTIGNDLRLTARPA